MTLTEVIADLDMVGAYYPGDSERLDAVRAHLHPYTQSITPERLEAAGFERDGDECWREFGRVTLRYKPGTRLVPVRLLTGIGSVPLPGVRSMGHVLSLIEMLEGGDHAASDC